jgi:hypothetical protein
LSKREREKVRQRHRMFSTLNTDIASSVVLLGSLLRRSGSDSDGLRTMNQKELSLLQQRHDNNDDDDDDETGLPYAPRLYIFGGSVHELLTDSSHYTGDLHLGEVPNQMRWQLQTGKTKRISSEYQVNIKANEH